MTANQRRATNRRSMHSRIGTATAVAALLLGSALFPTAAWAVPTPSNGPTGGGTVVTDSLPLGVTFSDLVGGGEQSTALGSDGKIYSWGSNTAGQIGDGTTTQRPTPQVVQMPAGVTFSDLSSGDQNMLAVGSDGHVYGWGFNGYGQVGDGTTTNRSTPTLTALPSGLTFTRVEAGRYHSMALASNGELYTWGANPDGRLGNGNPAWTTSPGLASVPAGVTFVELSAGESTSSALTDDGQMYIWGNGISTPTLKPAPAGVRFTSISTNSSYTAAGDDGNFYRLPTATSTQFELITPPSGVTFTDVKSSPSGLLALDANGQAYASGINNYGQIGDGTTTIRPDFVAVQMPAGVAFTQIEGGQTHTLAQGDDGNTYAWGANYVGQIGDNTTTTRLTPVLVDRVLTVTEVLFGGVPGTNVTQSNGIWSATTPAGCGPVDVVVTWELFGATSTATFEDGFTFGTPPVVVNQPVGGAIATGGSATLESTASGDDTPTVQWQVASSEAGPWTNVSGETSSTLEVTPETSSFYRAVFTNCNGETVSEAASVTVQEPPKITTKSLANGTVDEGYSATVKATGDKPMAFAVAAGSLPPGLTLDPATGRISGSPTKAGTFTFTVTATNDVGTDSHEYTVKITEDAIVVPPDSNGNGGVNSGSGADSGADLAVTGSSVLWVPFVLGSVIALAGVASLLARRRVIS